MRHTLLLATILLSGGIFVSSCSTDELSETQRSVKRIEASICDFQVEQDDDETRTSFTLGSNGYEAVWATGDILGIYPLGGDQVAFPISDGVGTATAVFDGGAWALRGTYKYAAYYPFSKENYTISESAIPVTYLGQKQSSNNGTAHLSKYDYMAAAATQPSSNGSVTLPFKHLGAYLLLPLTLPKAGTYTQLILTSNSGKFITEGTVDLSAATPAIKATKYSESITMDLNNITLTSDNLVLTLNMLIAPVDLSGSTIEIAVKDNQGNIYKNTTEWTRSKAFSANTTSKIPRTLDSEGTGGEIEGGGGLEEDGETPNMHNGHEYVDLGLPSGTLWASCNLGASNPWEHGYYYQWGGLTPVTDTNPGYDNIPFYEGKLSSDIFTGWTKYIPTGQEFFAKNGVADNKLVLEPEDDAAHVNWGSRWRLPTEEELVELCNNCTWKWSTQNGVDGYKITSWKNNNSIFLPVRGHQIGSTIQWSFGYYWSSTLYISDPEFAWSFYITSIGKTFSYRDRWLDCCIRPVCIL